MDQDIIAQLLSQGVDLLAAILFALLAFATKEIIAWLQTRRKKEGSDYLNDVTQRLVRIADTVVARGMQTRVKQLKSQLADGEWTDAEKRALLNDAVNDVLTYAGKDLVKDLEAAMDPPALKKFVVDTVEASVARWKAQYKATKE